LEAHGFSTNLAGDLATPGLFSALGEGQLGAPVWLERFRAREDPPLRRLLEVFRWPVLHSIAI